MSQGNRLSRHCVIPLWHGSAWMAHSRESNAEQYDMLVLLISILQS